MDKDCSETRSQEIRVLLSLAPPDGTTRFVDQLTAEANPSTQYLFFSWRTALLGGYDVFHIHWPEFLLRSRHLPVRLLRHILFAIFLIRLKLRRIPVVRTLHNIEPHEPGTRLEALLLRCCDELTTIEVRLNEETPSRGRPLRTILHGHYKERFRLPADVAPVPGRVLYFGLIRPYKGVDHLIDCFRDLDDPRLTLRIVGNPTPALRSIIERACSVDPRISCDLRFVPDDDLAAEVRRAELIVLPYREMHNSGAILVALSLGRHVLVPRSTSNERLASEVGTNWIYMFDGILTSGLLEAAHAHAAAGEGRDTSPVLAQRDWSRIAEQHYRVYAEALTIKANG